MRIALRTGAGRGAWELAGRQGKLAASDLFHREISYELTPELIIPGRSTAELRQGKPRINLNDLTRGTTTHFYRLLSAVLLLPTPKRELKATHGKELLHSGAYSMEAIKIDVADLDEDRVILRPTDLLLGNADGLQEELGFTERMARVIRVWEVAQQLDTRIAELVRNWETAVWADDPDYKTILRSAQMIIEELHTDRDPLPELEQRFGLIKQMEEGTSVPTDNNVSPSNREFGLIDDISPEQAVIERVKVWRLHAARGFAARKFSRDVSFAYDYRCLFSGQRLPKLEITESPGVDSAHILPWSTHDLNSVRNGICLSKQCHWAFDQGILKFAFNENSNMYTVTLSDKVQAVASAMCFDLDYFKSLTGPIPTGRLPQDQALWPSPIYIQELNRYMFGD